MSFLFIIVGMFIMVMAIYRYSKLLKLNRQQTYTSGDIKRRAEYVSLILLYLFLFCYIAVFFYMLFAKVSIEFLFVVAVFFFGAIFVYISVRVQATNFKLLSDKNIEIIRTFVNAIDMKDSYTKGHSQHVYMITRIFCEVLPEKLISNINKEMLFDAALLHDIGKLSISDNVLNKRGALSGDDWVSMRTHPENGKKILDDTCFSGISEWVLYHHERVDGTGYYKLKKEDIPLEAKIISIADTYSALCTDRVYRARNTHAEALEIITQAAGTQLCDELVGYFLMIDSWKLENLYDELIEKKRLNYID